MPRKSNRPVPSSILLRRGQNLRKRREELGLSQAQLAANAGTTQQTVDRIERGQTGFSRALPAIAKALGIRLGVNTREIYDETVAHVQAAGVSGDLPQEIQLPEESQLVPAVISNLEGAVRFALSQKYSDAGKDIEVKLFSDEGSLLNFEAIAYLAQASGVATEAERRIMIKADELRRAIIDSPTPWTWDLEGGARDVAQEIVEAYDVAYDGGGAASIWARCGIVLMALSMKFRLGASVAADLLKGEADRILGRGDAQ